MQVRNSVVPSLARSLPALLFLSILYALPALTQDVLTYHNSNSRTGYNNKETTLTFNNVNSASFGKLFVIPTDGVVDAEPLYLSAVSISGVNHNLLIVVTEHGTVYADDADTGAVLWKVSTLKAGETTSDNRGCSQINPEIGITATPVIARPKVGNPTIFVVAMSKDATGHYHQRLHALDATNGREVHNGPVLINAKYPGTGDNSSGGFVFFDPAQYDERAGLVLVNNTVYLAWGSHCDNRPYTGWIMAYNANTLAQTAVLNVTPNANSGAIWNSGTAMAADGAGNIFLLVGNGVFDSTLNSSGFPADGDYGNAFLRLSTKTGLAVSDYFEMFNQASENAGDIDLGSGGAILLDQKDTSGKTWQLGIGAGKDTNLYIVNRATMGKFNSSSNRIYQQLTGVLPGGVWSMPAAFNNNLYYGPVGSPILKFQFTNAKLSSTVVARTSNAFSFPGTTPSISANAGQNAIVWACSFSSPAVLHAYNAQTLIELYNTDQASGGRDHFGNGNKFITPMIAHGKVYVGTNTGVGVFGLLK
jgi:hypothetical protein